MTASSTTGELLLTYLAQHLGKLKEQDRLLGVDHHDGVHQLRVAARRMRSVLATYSRILEPEAGDALRADLRWLGTVLSPARDAQVLRRRLDDLVAAQPGELVLGRVAARIDDELRAEFRSGRDSAVAALEGARYLQLLERLELFVEDPPFGERAATAATALVPRLLERDLSRLRARHRDAEAAADPHERELALHEVRKAAKRLRYAAESAKPVLSRAEVLAAAAEELQELLGDLQDSVVARQRLREIGVRAHLAGENGFTFGRLHGLQEAVAAEAEQGYFDAFAGLPTKRLRGWLAG